MMSILMNMRNEHCLYKNPYPLISDDIVVNKQLRFNVNKMEQMHEHDMRGSFVG